MPCAFSLVIGLCVSLRPVHWLNNVVSNHSGQYCCIAIATSIKRLKNSIAKPMRITQCFEATARYCFQSLPRKAIKSTVNELGFHQQDLTSVIVCSSAEILKTTSWPLVTAWLSPWLNQRSLLWDLFIIRDDFVSAITEFPVCMYLLFVSAIQNRLHFLLIYKQCNEIKWDSRRAFFSL